MQEIVQGETISARRLVFFRMWDDADGITGATGLTVTAEIVKADETSYSAVEGGASDFITEISDGDYVIELSENDVDTVGPARLKFTATDALDQIKDIEVNPSVDSTDTETLSMEKSLEIILAMVMGKTTVSTVDSDTKRVIFFGRDGVTEIARVDVSVTTSGLREASVIA